MVGTRKKTAAAVVLAFLTMTGMGVAPPFADDGSGLVPDDSGIVPDDSYDRP